jgi:DNA-binding GntR family transcriptional regulator
MPAQLVEPKGMSDSAEATTLRAPAVHIEEAPYQHLRRAIVSGEFMPNERLVEAELAAALGFPRAAVRMALIRLAQENLVERLPNRGARVRRISENEVIELLEARMALECLTAEHAARAATEDDVCVLRSIVAEMECMIDQNLVLYGELNTRLHAEIVRISKHRVAERMLEDLRSRSTVFHFRPPMPVPRDPWERLRQHKVIVEAIAAHDAPGAVSAMREHLSDIPTWMRANIKGATR